MLLSKNLLIVFFALALFTSCVSQKKYSDLKRSYAATNNELLSYKAKNMDLEVVIAQNNNQSHDSRNYVNMSQMYFNGILARLDSKKMNYSSTSESKTRLTFKNIPDLDKSETEQIEKSLESALERYIAKHATNVNVKDCFDISFKNDILTININHDFMIKNTEFVDAENPNNVLKYLSDAIVTSNTP